MQMPIPLPNLLLASTNFTHAASIGTAISQFVVERFFPVWSLLIDTLNSINLNNLDFNVDFNPYAGVGGNDLGTWIRLYWAEVMEWLEQPQDIFAIILAWAITFTVIMILILSLGFGSAGIIAGSLAAAFQSFMYGGFTPAGGIFATLTSMAMLGTLMWPADILAAVLATGAAAIVWALGVGR
ncbi:hypothetical protein VTN77DRAFT_2574 [Rasamsonia byssochlamydoides]|uniref:uncharacterized protein n=1 Tax=Rasamsonia byssochlamydoides TaxID=89139 RepID=UPI00374415B9